MRIQCGNMRYMLFRMSFTTHYVLFENAKLRMFSERILLHMYCFAGNRKKHRMQVLPVILEMQTTGFTHLANACIHDSKLFERNSSEACLFFKDKRAGCRKVS